MDARSLVKRARRKAVFEIRRRRFRLRSGILPPVSVVLEFDYHCPLRCKTCRLWTREYRELKAAGRTKLSVGEMKKVLDDLASYGVRCAIFLGGEPFLYPEVFPLIAHARALGMVSFTFTNGYLMNEELVDRILDSGIESICFSLDGPTGEIHDGIRGRQGVFASAVYGMKAIQEGKKRRGAAFPRLSIQTTVSSRNLESLPDLVDLARSLEVPVIRFQHLSNVDDRLVEATDRILGEPSAGMHIYGSLPQELKLTEAQMERIPEIVREIERRKGGGMEVWIDPVLKENNRAAMDRGIFPRDGCTSLWSSATVSAYGDVTPCAMLNDYTMGNVRETSFRDIWCNDKYRALRARIDKKLLPICMKCCDKL